MTDRQLRMRGSWPFASNHSLDNSFVSLVGVSGAAADRSCYGQGCSHTQHHADVVPESLEEDVARLAAEHELSSPSQECLFRESAHCDSGRVEAAKNGGRPRGEVRECDLRVLESEADKAARPSRPCPARRYFIISECFSTLGQQALQEVGCRGRLQRVKLSCIWYLGPARVWAQGPIQAGAMARTAPLMQLGAKASAALPMHMRARLGIA